MSNFTFQAETTEFLIESWKAAYKAANHKPAPDLFCDSGWFRFGTSVKAYRRREIETMRDRLRSSAVTEEK